MAGQTEKGNGNGNGNLRGKSDTYLRTGGRWHRVSENSSANGPLHAWLVAISESLLRPRRRSGEEDVFIDERLEMDDSWRTVAPHDEGDCDLE